MSSPAPYQPGDLGSIKEAGFKEQTPLALDLALNRLSFDPMSDVTRILDAIERGQAESAEELLPLVYDELRRIAAYKMSAEAPGHTLQPTALGPEAWLRLVGSDNQPWQNRAHFFAAAAEAMRRILVENARRKRRLRHGGGQQRVELDETNVPAETDDDKLLQVNEALEELAAQDPVQAEIVKLRFFVGLKNGEIAGVLNISEKTVQRYWAHAKAWLYERMQSQK